MKEKAKKIKAVIFDVDGTLTDGVISIDNKGNERKNFNVKDGFAIAKAVEFGIKCAIITGRKSEVVNIRAKELNITEVYQGIADKQKAISDLQKKMDLVLMKLHILEMI